MFIPYLTIFVSRLISELINLCSKREEPFTKFSRPLLSAIDSEYYAMANNACFFFLSVFLLFRSSLSHVVTTIVVSEVSFQFFLPRCLNPSCHVAKQEHLGPVLKTFLCWEELLLDHHQWSIFLFYFFNVGPLKETSFLWTPSKSCISIIIHITITDFQCDL